LRKSIIHSPIVPARGADEQDPLGQQLVVICEQFADSFAPSGHGERAGAAARAAALELLAGP